MFRARRRVPARTRQGFTMLEMVVTIAILTTVLAVLLPWVGTLLNLSTSQLNNATEQRATAGVQAALDRDLRHAVPCPATGTTVHTANGTTWALYTTANLDQPTATGTNLVTWSLSGTALARSSTPATLTADQCGPTDPEVDPINDPPSVTWTTFAAQVTPGTPAPGAGVVTLFTPTPAAQPRVAVVTLTTDSDQRITGTWPLPQILTALS